MKTWDDVCNTLEIELDMWAKKSDRGCTRYYVYYMPSSPEHDSGMLICKDTPANKDYELAMSECLPIHITKEQVYNRTIDIFKTLPVLDIA